MRKETTKAPRGTKGGTKNAQLPRERARQRILSVFVPSFVSFVVLVVSLSAQAPQRIVSLVPSLTEFLFAMGAGPQVVGVSSFDQEPPPVRALPRVGALVDPDVERVLSLRPDLVITYGSQTDLQAQLRQARIESFEYRHGGLPEVMATVRALGARIGRAREAESVAGDIERRIAANRARVAGRNRPRTLLVFGRERGALRNIYASGGRGFLHDMLEAAGGTNVFADVDRESVQATTELILARAPDVILEVRSAEMGAIGSVEREVRSWAPLASVPAVRQSRVIILTGRELTVPGPQIAEVVERMSRALHP